MEEITEDINTKKAKIFGLPKEYLKYVFFPIEGSSRPYYNIFNPDKTVNESKKQALAFTMNYIQNLNENLKQCKNVYYYGLPNKKLGISLLATFIMRGCIEKGKKCKFVFFPTLCENLGYDYEVEENRSYYECDVLIIDSISSKSQTGAKISDGISDLILHRRQEDKVTIFASYISPEEMASRYSEALISYFDESIIRVHIDFEDGQNSKYIDIEKLINFLKEKKKEKKTFPINEINEILNKFINNYHMY